MAISTRGRYALRVMVDLAEHCGGGFIPMKDVADRQDISLKYLERIMPDLTRGGVAEGVHGKGGGYRLTRPPESITALEILRLAEGDLAPVACLQAGAKPCPRAAECRTLPLWKGYHEQTLAYFGGVTLADLMRSPGADSYII